MSAAPPSDAAHILVVDDDQRIRDLLKRFLGRNGYLVTTARNAAHASKLVESLRFDLMVVDVMMPGEDGVSFTRRVRDDTGTAVLLLTARGGANDRITGLEAGADDYLPKPFEPRELLLRVAAILRRARLPAPGTEAAGAPQPLGLGEASFDLMRGELRRGDQTIRLTSSEQALMRVFSRRPNEIISRARLADELGGAHGDVNERAVDVQITRLRRKIERDPRNPHYLQTVRGAGYMLTPD